MHRCSARHTGAVLDAQVQCHGAALDTPVQRQTHRCSARHTGAVIDVLDTQVQC